MNTTAHLIEIKDIIFHTSSNEISLTGMVYRSNLSYESQIELTSTQLNQLINELQRTNSEIEVSQLFVSKTDGNGNGIFYFDATTLKDRTISLLSIEQDQVLRKIRA